MCCVLNCGNGFFPFLLAFLSTGASERILLFARFSFCLQQILSTSSFLPAKKLFCWLLCFLSFFFSQLDILLAVALGKVMLCRCFNTNNVQMCGKGTGINWLLSICGKLQENVHFHLEPTLYLTLCAMCIVLVSMYEGNWIFVWLYVNPRIRILIQYLLFVL